jgi:cyclopropane fatty-acyl-phospholipid synthase-like methyltransferase
MWDALLRRLLRGSNAETKILDVGCAPGRWIIYFEKNLGLHAYGIDYSTEGIESTKRRLARQGARAEVYAGDFMNYDFPLKFDVIVSFGVIEHYRDSARFLTRCSRCLVEGGLCICGIPNMASSFYGSMQRAIDHDVWSRHVPYVLNDLKRSFTGSGFSHVEGTYFGGFKIGVINFSKLGAFNGLMGPPDFVTHLLYRAISRSSESTLWAPYIFVWGRK